jgi:phosphoglycerol transferase MdoB-like AlkP superfamily enzyme
LSSTLVFWWGVCLVIQSAERLFLVATSIPREPPTAAALATTLRAGFRADLMGAAGGIVLAVVLGLVIGAGLAIARRWRKGQAVPASPWKVGITVGSVVVALLMLAVATADMGYYRYSQRRVDLVFLETVIDVFSPPTRAHLDSSLVDRQTAAQLADGARWVGYAAAFAVAMAAAIAAWWLAFTRLLGPLLRRCLAAAPRTSAAVLVLALITTGTSFDLESRLEVYRVSVVSSTYYMLAQNPFWSIWDAIEQVIGTRVAGTEAGLLQTVPEKTAVEVTRGTVAPGATFPSPRYPMVHTTVGDSGVRLARPDQRGGRRPRILMIFAEGLDRRFLGQTVRGIRVTPFLDRLRGETVYFEHFFSNGSSTSHGLFASFCSAFPRFGLSPMRTHYGSDFLCLPEALKRGGYRSEMVVGQSRDRAKSHLGSFMARHGLDALYDERNFAPATPRNRLGVLDGALLDLVRSRVETLHAADRPFFLATLTTSTHHPFKVPQDHPEVRALAGQSDRYVTALRYFDVEFERFFSGLRRDGLLRNTVVLILGDHGRHGKVGRTDAEAMVGNFLAPLFVWMDESLVDPTIFRPRTVSAVASQVDLAPTILSMTGLMPGLTPFVGRDLSCAFVRECLADNVAYLSNVSENLLGLVDRDGIWMYPVRGRTGHEMDLGSIGASRERAVIDPQVAPRQQLLLSLYVTGNLLLLRNRLWSTREFWDPGHGVTAPSDRGRPAASSHRRVTARATHPRSRARASGYRGSAARRTSRRAFSS